MTAPQGLSSELTPLEFGLFRDWIHRHSGIFLEDTKADSLRLSLHTRAAGHGFTDYRDYFRLLSENEGEFRELMNLVTINETSFFRFPAQFEALRESVVPALALARSADSAPFRVWSAGCSTGEEPYTIAMTLLDSLLTTRGMPFEVVGTDVSSQALERARSALYSERALASLPPDTAERWFERVGALWRPVERVRRACRFEYHNLIRESHPPRSQSGWDVIFCRNVTIYFQVETTRRVIQNLFDALNPGGYLFLGHSETLAGVSDRFETIEAAGVFFYRKPLSLSSGFSTPSRPRTHRALVAPDRPTRVVIPAQSSRTVASGQPAVRVREPEDVKSRLAVAFAHADLGDLETAARETAEILAAHPLSAPARYLLGVIRREQGATAAAASEFRRTLYIDRDFVLAHFALAGLHRQAGEYAAAAREYDNTLRTLGEGAEGDWTDFLGGFTPELLVQSCERGLEECRSATVAAKGAPRTRR